MPRKPNPPPDDKDQAARFIQTAKSLEVNDTAEAFERALKVIKPVKPPVKKQENKKA